ncbi:hypothetical protein EPN28_00915 [Patescibacteria group bacterium]|nr:MAG: hypothetical protein EPN28_00915 [Patescibacteria group bacterium]
MLIFIDESGIHKKIDHSTFVLVYVEIANYEKISEKILNTESRLGIETFHWSEAAWPVKKKFMEVVLDLDFKVKLAVIRNPVNPAKELERVLSHMVIERDIAKVYIDGKKPKWYERKIKKILRDKEITVKKLKTVNNESEAGARLADMVAGLTRWYFDNKNKGKFLGFFEKLKRKIVVIIE